MSKSNYTLIISLYEESLEERRKEFLSCIEINKYIFNKIIILYERPKNNLFNTVFEKISKIKKDAYKNSLAKIEIKFIDDRPTYTDFFRLSIKDKETNQNSWYVIANSDIFFDNSLNKLEEIRNKENALIALSRYDKHYNLIKENQLTSLSSFFNYEDLNKNKWDLICIKKNDKLLSDIPNFFSADSWIYKNEPKNWEKYIFKIGTFFCDSFFNKQALIDKEDLYNPCLSIRSFHNHNPINNSSLQKSSKKEEKTAIYEWGQNYFLNNLKHKNEIIVHGVLWSNIQNLENNNFHKGWCDQSIFLSFKSQSNIYHSFILLEIIFERLINKFKKPFNSVKQKNIPQEKSIIYFIHYDNKNNIVNKIIIEFIKFLFYDSEFIVSFILENKGNKNINYKYINLKNFIKIKKSNKLYLNEIEKLIFESAINQHTYNIEDKEIQILKNKNYEHSNKFINNYLTKFKQNK